MKELREPLDLDDLRSYLRELAPHLHWIQSVLNLREEDRTLRLRYEDLYFAALQAQRPGSAPSGHSLA
jgi:hypothetical protein